MRLDYGDEVVPGRVNRRPVVQAYRLVETPPQRLPFDEPVPQAGIPGGSDATMGGKARENIEVRIQLPLAKFEELELSPHQAFVLIGGALVTGLCTVVLTGPVGADDAS
jgi:hypothetical protein